MFSSSSKTETQNPETQKRLYTKKNSASSDLSTNTEKIKFKTSFQKQKNLFAKQMFFEREIPSTLYQDIFQNNSTQELVKTRFASQPEHKHGKFSRLYQADVFEMLERLPDNFAQLVICDGPYGVTKKQWDKIDNIQEYNLKLIKSFARVLKEGGALYLFGKHNALDFIDYRPFLNLNSRIVWYQPSRLAQGRKGYTNNYDMVAYFTKGKASTFHLDNIRVPQLVELEHRLRCEKVPSVAQGKYGKTKFHPQGKNPGDVWGDVKQLTYRSRELLDRAYLNTIQKPQKLMERFILASSSPRDIVLEPFAGTATASFMAREHQREFIAIENDPFMIDVIERRLDIHAQKSFMGRLGTESVC